MLSTLVTGLVVVLAAGWYQQHQSVRGETRLKQRLYPFAASFFGAWIMATAIGGGLATLLAIGGTILGQRIRMRSVTGQPVLPALRIPMRQRMGRPAVQRHAEPASYVQPEPADRFAGLM